MTSSLQTKMTEMRLDLCIQSTNHLLETVSNIKENIRILEVFLNSGLKSVFSGNNEFTSGEYSTSEGRGSFGPDQRFHQMFAELPATSVRHTNCCCMCRFRQIGVERENLNGSSMSRASAVTASLSSNPDSSKKSRPAPPIPRLNRTASLRRETVLQRQRAQEISRKKSFL